jgi:hypothetical protein
MPIGRTRIAAFALAGLAALLVGFHGVSMLMTVTQLGASPEKPALRKSHASLVPRPAIPVEVNEPARTVAPEVQAAAPTRTPAEAPNAQPVIEADPVAPSAADTVAAQPSNAVQPSNLADLAAATTAQAQLVDVPAFTEEPPPRRERRRYRAVRPDLHRVY